MSTAYNSLLILLLFCFSLTVEGQSTEALHQEQKPDSMVQIQPDFPGGVAKMYKFIHKEMKYPKQARKDGIQGKVYVGFVVDADGAVDEVIIQRGVSPELDAEAVRVIEAMPRWSPGRINGKPVKCRFTLPIVFNR